MTKSTPLKTCHLTPCNEPFALCPDHPESAWMEQWYASEALCARIEECFKGRVQVQFGSAHGVIGRWFYDVTGRRYTVFELIKAQDGWVVQGVTH